MEINPTKITFPHDCEFIHPKHTSCIMQNLDTWYNSTRKSIPLYTALNALALIFQYKKVYKSPVTELSRTAVSIARSSIFLVCFIFNYREVFVDCIWEEYAFIIV
jgi:hypothetical protein